MVTKIIGYSDFMVVRVAWRVAVRYQVPRYCGWKLDICQLLSDAVVLSDTKYRDIADGNSDITLKSPESLSCQIPSTAI